MVVLPRKLLISKFTDSRQMDTEQWFVKKIKKKERKKRTKANSLCLNTQPFLNPYSSSLNPPACPVLAVSRIIIYLYLNTHKANTGKGTTTREEGKRNPNWVIQRARRDGNSQIKKQRETKQMVHYTDAPEVIKVKERALNTCGQDQTRLS